MTIRQRMADMLERHGLWPEDIPKVLDRYLASPAGEPMRGRLDDRLDAYPEAIEVVTWMAVRQEALAFIDETCPDAWYRSLFDDSNGDAPP